MKKRERKVRLFSIIASLLLIFSLFTPAISAASGNIGQQDIHFEVDTLSKISTSLQDQFSESHKVSFLIKFKEKANTEKAKSKAKLNAKKLNLSSHETMLQQRSAVISELKATSFHSQEEVLNYLEQEEVKGNAGKITSFYIVNGMAVTATKDVAEKIASFSEVEKILPNETRELQVVETNENNSVKTDSTDIEWNIEHIGAPEVWEMGIDGTGTVVANLDSGVDWEHPALKDKYRGYNKETGEVDHTYSWFDPSGGDEKPSDGNGHGTHTMGTMVGSEENGSNQIGVAPGAKWIGVKVFNSFGETNDAILIEGAQWLLAPGGRADMAPDVVNNSWSSGPGLDEWYRDIVKSWRDAQIFPEFAAGNISLANPGGPGSVPSPANYPESFAVGATDENDVLANFSLRGPSPYGEIKPDITAPGVNIRSSVPGGGYNSSNGTSMASPAVTATAALLRQVDASLEVEDLERILKETAIPLTDDEYAETPNNGYGYGLVDAYAAVSSVKDGAGRVNGKVVSNVEDNEEPTFEHQAPEEIFTGLNQKLTIHGADNVSVTSVTLHYQSNNNTEKTMEAVRQSGDYKSGEYVVEIPSEHIEAGEFKYRWVINDYGNNTVTSEEYVVSVKERLTVGYFEDFETEPVGWSSYGVENSWEWGVPTSGPNHATSGDKVYATNLSGNYEREMDATLEMPPVFIPEGQTFLQFQSWHAFTSLYGTDWNYGRLMISTDRENWEELQRFGNESEDWVHVEIDLSSFAGQEVYIGFNAYSDFRITDAGWYIDDVAISDTSIYSDDEVPPTFEHIPPTETYSGMDLQLNVDVSDDIKIASVELAYKNSTSDWKTVQAELSSGDDQSGNFIATIPEQEITGDQLTYQWIINDYGNNEVVSEEYVVPIKTSVTVGYFEDFEGSVTGWSSFGDNDNWELGIPTSGPREAYTGEKVYATNLSGNYQSRTKATLMMPPVSVPAGESYLKIAHWHQFTMSGGQADLGKVVISTDKENWEELVSFDRRSEGWIESEINLSSYSNQDVYIGFLLETESYLGAPGWYIDNVSITDTASNPENQREVNELIKLDASNSITNELGKENVQLPKGPNEQKATHLQDELNPKLIPLNAHVSVLESGRTVKTNPEFGTFSFLHAAGAFTLRAEAYGYHSREQEVTIEDNGNTEVNFMLEEKAEVIVDGTVIDQETDEPIKGATVLLVEDANIAPVQTDENGEFSFNAYEGNYTVKVVSKGYYPGEINVTLNQNKTLNISLDPLYTHSSEEIYYDDGTAENAKAFYNAGNGWAVKMSLADNQQSALVTEGIFKFWDNRFPSPGGTKFAIEVWDAKGSGGLPGKKIAGPIEADAIRDANAWTVIDLTEENIIVTEDFYMVYMQTQDGDNSPGLAIDENGKNSERSYEFVGGGWAPVTGTDEGNYMIRANVEYLVESPIITSPDSESITNESEVTVEGKATPESEVILYNNDTEVGTTTVSDEGKFTFVTNLEEGHNTFTAVSTFDTKEFTSHSVTITLDTIAPEVTIDSPSEGELIEANTVTVEGTVSDENLDKVTINGEAAEIIDSTYSQAIELDLGENIIEVSAVDLAGNMTTKTITVQAEYDLSIIKNVLPDTDRHVVAGDQVEVSFESEVVAGDASFIVKLPTQTTTQSVQREVMEENEPGLYTGTWTVPDNLMVDGAVIEVQVTDGNGNTSVREAEGRLFITTETPEPIQKPEIFDVIPSTDLTVYSGDEVDISFTSNTEGGEAVYQIQLPHEDATQSVSGHAMTEVEPGVYKGTWIVPENLNLDGAIIQVAITDENGSTAIKEAEGKLYISQKPEEPQEKIDRLSGKTRFDTAVEVSKEGWETADTVVLARSDEYADALAGVPLAHKLDAPILLTRPSELMASTFDEIKRLGAEKVVILGGTQAVSSDIVAELEAEGIAVERISGKTRYDTAVEIAKKVAPEGANKVVVASGLDFPDALSVASQAAVNELPILLTRANTLPAQTEEALASLGVSETVVIGGTMAVNDAVLKQLPGAERVSGEKPHSDRYGTNIAIQNYFNVDSKHLYVATGQSYADALTGAVLAAKNNSSVLLVRSENLPEAITSYIESNDIEQLTLFGGTTAIGKDVQDVLKKLLK